MSLAQISEVEVGRRAACLIDYSQGGIVVDVPPEPQFVIEISHVHRDGRGQIVSVGTRKDGRGFAGLSIGTFLERYEILPEEGS